MSQLKARTGRLCHIPYDKALKTSFKCNRQMPPSFLEYGGHTRWILHEPSYPKMHCGTAFPLEERMECQWAGMSSCGDSCIWTRSVGLTVSFQSAPFLAFTVHEGRYLSRLGWVLHRLQALNWDMAIILDKETSCKPANITLWHLSEEFSVDRTEHGLQ